MANWELVPQEIGKEGDTTLCKVVKFFPRQSGGVVTGFGRLKSPVLRVFVRREGDNDEGLKITLSGGTYKVHQPPRQVFPIINGKKQWWGKKETIPGEVREFAPKNFSAFAAEKFGIDTAINIMMAFNNPK